MTKKQRQKQLELDRLKFVSEFIERGRKGIRDLLEKEVRAGRGTELAERILESCRDTNKEGMYLDVLSEELTGYRAELDYDPHEFDGWCR
jgi:hypothetical protein